MLMRHRLRYAPAAVALFACACGAEMPSAPPPLAASTATPTAVPTPTATPSPTPTAAPPAEPGNVFPGPVDHVSIKLYAVRERSGNLRAFTEQEGSWVVYVGETAIFDSTAKNEQGRPCESDGVTEWDWEETHFAIRRVRSPNPFLLYAEAVDEGTVTVAATIDGKGSNRVEIRVVNRGD
jgi:hypothetical protein